MGLWSLAGTLLIVSVSVGSPACSGHAVGSSYPEPSDKCSMDPAQVGTLAESVARLPVKVSIDAGWKLEELEVIEQAVGTWNEFSMASLGRPLFELRPMQPAEPMCLNDMTELHKFCDSGLDGLWILPVLTDYHWRSMGFTQMDLGATRRCSTGRDGKPPSMVVVINWTEKRGSILGAVALHELGHVLGLKHTCAHGAGGEVRCSGLGEDHPYMMSVMAPNFYVNTIRRGQDQAYYSGAEMVLSSNDIERAFCLYRDQ